MLREERIRRREGKGRGKKGKVKAYSKVVPKNSGDTLSPFQTLLHRLSIMKLSQTHQTGLAICLQQHFSTLTTHELLRYAVIFDPLALEPQSPCFSLGLGLMALL